MLMVRLILSTLSLVAEWPLWFPSVIFVFEFLSAAVGFFPTVFFWMGCLFGVLTLSVSLSVRWYILGCDCRLLFIIIIYISYLHSGVVAISFDYS